MNFCYLKVILSVFLAFSDVIAYGHGVSWVVFKVYYVTAMLSLSLGLSFLSMRIRG